MINVQKRFFYTDLLKKTLQYLCSYQETNQETNQERHTYFQKLGINFLIQIKKNELGNDPQL